MPHEWSTDETIAVATYSNRQNADLAKTQLEEQGLSALIIADDVHPPFQLTEGVELRVLEQDAEQARRLLSLAEASSAEVQGEDRRSEREDASGTLLFSQGGFVKATAWIYVAGFLLMITIIIMGLLISS